MFTQSPKVTCSHTDTADRYLYVHLDNGLSDECSSEEGPERNEEMAACDPSKVKQRIGNLSTGRQTLLQSGAYKMTYIVVE